MVLDLDDANGARDEISVSARLRKKTAQNYSPKALHCRAVTTGPAASMGGSSSGAVGGGSSGADLALMVNVGVDGCC